MKSSSAALLLILLFVDAGFTKTPPPSIPLTPVPAPVRRAPAQGQLPRWDLVPAGRASVAGGAYEVETRIPWSANGDATAERWTVDGTALEVLVFYSGVADGKALWTDDKGTAYPTFRKSMSQMELIELVQGTYTAAGRRVSPARNIGALGFGSTEGVRFEFDYVIGSGLEKRALVAAGVLDENLHVIMYVAPSRFFFDRYAEEVEHILRSISRPEPPATAASAPATAGGTVPTEPARKDPPGPKE